MRRLRSRIGVYGSALLLFVGAALVAQATQPVTSSQMHEYVLTMIGAAGVVVFGAFWILLVTISGRSEKALMASVGRLEEAVGKLLTKMDEHNDDEMAHPRGSAARINPINAAIVRVEESLHEIKTKVNVLVEGQKEAVAELDEQDVRLGGVEAKLTVLCAEHHILHGRALQQRRDDPEGVDLDKLRREP